MSKVFFENESKLRNKIEKIFKDEKKKITLALPYLDLDIQHIGSTAIPNSLTKADLDIQVRIEQKDFSGTCRKLLKLYKQDQKNKPTKTYMGFIDNVLEIPVGIQLTVIGSKDDDDFMKIRDILLNKPKYQKEYNILKSRFHGQSMIKYRTAKNKFFRELQKRMKKWQRKLKLQNWKLDFELINKFKRKDDYPQTGDIKIDKANKEATILILKNLKNKSIEKIIVHELVHLVLYDWDISIEKLCKNKSVLDKHLGILEQTVWKITRILLKDI